MLCTAASTMHVTYACSLMFCSGLHCPYTDVFTCCAHPPLPPCSVYRDIYTIERMPGNTDNTSFNATTAGPLMELTFINEANPQQTCTTRLTVPAAKAEDGCPSGTLLRIHSQVG